MLKSRIGFLFIVFIMGVLGSAHVMADTSAPAKWDILFVVDDSGSMSGHQQWLSRSAGEFINIFDGKNIDYQLAVVTTSTTEHPGQFMGPMITNTSTNKEQLLSAYLKPGTVGDSTERPFDSIVLAIDKNKDFRRPDSRLIVVMVTDAEDQSTSSVHDVLRATWFDDPDHRPYFFSTLANHANACEMDDPSVEPLRLTSLINYTYGGTAAICDPAVVSKISDWLTSTLSLRQ